MKAPGKLAILFIMIVIAVSVPAGAAQAPSKRVLAIQTLYNYFFYPNNQLVFPASQAVSPVDALFSPTAQGRIAPLGEGHDLQTAKKYFFGLGQGFSPSFEINSVTFRSITDQPPLVIVEVDLTVSALSGPPPYVHHVRETGQFMFDKTFHIVSFDLSIPYFDAYMLKIAGDPSDPLYAALGRESVCELTQFYCAGQDAQYPDATSCQNGLSSIPVGTWNRVSSNTLICRQFHAQYLSIDPTKECPNMGITGGTQCVDTPYEDYFNETF